MQTISSFPSIPKRRLGKTDIFLPVIGFGASPLGGVFGDVAQESANLAVRRAIELGMNYFDTSPFYGLTKSESVLGNALKGIERQSFIVSTKVGRYGDAEFDFSAERTKKSIHESLNRLGLDYVDLCICHDIEFTDIHQVISETIPTLKELQKEGKIRAIGISGLPLELFEMFLEKCKDIDFILSYCHYTMFDTTLKRLYDEKLKQLGIGVINASPLSMGLLTSGGPPTWHPASDLIKSTCADLAKYCSQNNADVSEIALNFSLQADFTASTLVGIKDISMLEKNVRSLDSKIDQALLSECFEKLKVIKDQTWKSGKEEYNKKI